MSGQIRDQVEELEVEWRDCGLIGQIGECPDDHRKTAVCWGRDTEKHHRHGSGTLALQSCQLILSPNRG